MNLDINNMLVIGTVVKLKLSPQNVMIIGYTTEDDGEIFDYIGCVYPIGVFDLNHNLRFNVDDIEKVITEGYLSTIADTYKENHIKFINEVKSALGTK